MNISPPYQLHLALTLQTLSIPSTLILCFTSMLRERSIGEQDEKRLVRLYKQHAFGLELVQLFVVIVALGLITGNTVAAFETRTLIVDCASDNLTSFVFHNALVRNFYLFLSALCNLACVNMLDSWSLPQSVQDLTDPLFRLTRRSIGDYIKRPNEQEYQISHEEFFLSAVHHPYAYPYPPLQVPNAEPDISNNTNPSPKNPPTPTLTLPSNPLPNENINTQNPPPAPPLPPLSLKRAPSYTSPTKSSSLKRSSSKTPSPKPSSFQNKHAARKKRSVTFAVERRSVREIVGEFERGLLRA